MNTSIMLKRGPSDQYQLNYTTQTCPNFEIMTCKMAQVTHALVNSFQVPSKWWFAKDVTLVEHIAIPLDFGTSLQPNYITHTTTTNYFHWFIEANLIQLVSINCKGTFRNQMKNLTHWDIVQNFVFQYFHPEYCVSLFAMEDWFETIRIYTIKLAVTRDIYLICVWRVKFCHFISFTLHSVAKTRSNLIYIFAVIR